MYLKAFISCLKNRCVIKELAITSFIGCLEERCVIGTGGGTNSGIVASHFVHPNCYYCAIVCPSF